MAERRYPFIDYGNDQAVADYAASLPPRLPVTPPMISDEQLTMQQLNKDNAPLEWFPAVRESVGKLGSPLASGQEVYNRLTGSGGQERYQTWPEQLVRSGFALPADVYSGRTPVRDPLTGRTSQEVIERAQDLSALMGGGSVAGVGGEASLASSGMRKISAEYRGEHTSAGPDSGSPLHDVTANGTYPADFYGPNGLRYYGTGDDALDAISYRKIIDAKDNPDKMVKVYRAIPWEGKKPGYTLSGNNERSKINPGDWVTISKKYAEDHGESALNGKYAIVDKMVPAKEIFTSGDSLHEWGWHPSLMSDTSVNAPISALAKPVFYSALEHAVGNSKMPKADAEQWLGYLRNQPGVKQEELDFVLHDLPKGQITKGELEQYVQQHKVELKEVNRSGSTSDPDNFLSPKYSQWQLPGGKNYREMLLTLPDRSEAQMLREEAIRRGYGDKISQWPDQEFAQRYRDKVTNAADTGTFKSTHWDEPNVLAHIRTNERFIPDESSKSVANVNKSDFKGYSSYEHAEGPLGDPAIYGIKSNGDRVIVRQNFKSNDEAKAETDRLNANVAILTKGLNSLHVEEIQSDWHQKGRKEGYAGEKEALQPKFDAIEKKIMDSNDETILADPEIDSALKKAVDKKLITADEAKTYKRYTSIESGSPVPDAPFKSSWADLALKRIIAQAAREGKDAISWTPGEAQAARYDLSKHIDKVNLVPDPSGKFRIDAFKDNKKVIEHYAKDQNEVADVVGKEVAEKLFNNRNNHGAATVSGLDLKVGGEGMKAFYDKMLVDKANAIAKKFGGKVEQAEIRGDIGKPTDYANYDDWSKAISEKRKQPIHVLRITPELRDAALNKGFSLFADTGKVGAPLAALSRVEHNPFTLGAIEKQHGVKLEPVKSNPFETQRAYHGTGTPGFERFKKPDEDYTIDRMLGTHVAKDPEIANTFTGKSEYSFGREVKGAAGGVYPVNIPHDEKFINADKVHGAFDQTKIERAVMKTAFEKEPELLARYLEEARAVPKSDALQLAKDMASGKKVDLPVDGPGYDLDRFVNNFGGRPYNAADRAKAVEIFKKDAQDKGYVGIKYTNTSPRETATAKDKTSYVVFNPHEHIRNALTGQLMSDTSASAPLAALAKQYGVKLEPVAHNPFTATAFHGSPNPLVGDRIRPMSGIKINQIGDKFEVKDVVNNRVLKSDLSTTEAAHDWVDKNKLADFYSTPNPRLAQDYATQNVHGKGQNITPLLLDTSDYHTVDAKGQPWDAVNQFAINEANQLSKKGVIIKNVFDDADPMRQSRGPQIVYITLDPSTVRSKFAKFDPAKFKESGLLKAAGVPFDVSNQDGKDPFIDNTHDVPYGSGASNNGLVVHIDKRIPEYDAATGDLNLHKALALHERTEKPLMESGMSYEQAHHIATKAERSLVEALGGNWKEYEKVMNGYLSKTEHEKPQNPPDNLYLKPYPHDKQVLLEKHMAYSGKSMGTMK